jgi:hypothetical protein
MAQTAANTGRQFVARDSRANWRLRLLILILCSLAMIPFAVVTIVARQLEPTIGFLLFLVAWLFAFTGVTRIARTVAFDSVGVEVKTLLKTWRYRWDEIAAVSQDIVPARSTVGMRVVTRLKPAEPVENQSWFAKFIAQLAGGDGTLPFLLFDDLDVLRNALSRYGASAPADKPSTDGAGGMRMLLSACEGLGDINEVKMMGLLASIDLAAYDTTGQKVRESVLSGNWDAACVLEGTPGADWVHWYVIQREDGKGAILEVFDQVELWANAECYLARTLTPYDLDCVHPHVKDWTMLTLDAGGFWGRSDSLPATRSSQLDDGRSPRIARSLRKARR